MHLALDDSQPAGRLHKLTSGCTRTEQKVNKNWSESEPEVERVRNECGTRPQRRRHRNRTDERATRLHGV